jgi:N-acetylmuramoyl-L-alanine amidase
MEFKREFLIFILLFCGIFMLPSFLSAQKVQRVVIDAGHGGHDPGAVGKTSKEKDIVLSIALKTGKLIKDNLKDVEVIYTREKDVFVELHRRARIANEAKADLFISIHCNANKSTSPYGSETYVMGLHRSDANLAVAQLENASILLEDDYHVQYEGFDPKSPEGFIFFSMLQNAYLDQSLYLASGVQKYFREVVNLYDRGVKQAGFLVLYKTTMPSVLIEAGFISNAKEEKLLASEQGQNNIAKSIFNAVRDYKLSVERGKKSFPEAEDILAKDVNENKNETQEQGNHNSEPGNYADASNAQNASGLVFKVQFMISKTQIATSAKQFKNIPSVDYYLHQGMYKYTAGNESSFDKALKIRAEIVKQGYKDAFVVAFLNGDRIDVNKAREMSIN